MENAGTKEKQKILYAEDQESIARLVQFKLEISPKGLIDKAYASLLRNKTDLVVANALNDLSAGYRAFIIDKERRIYPVKSKFALARALLDFTLSA